MYIFITILFLLVIKILEFLQERHSSDINEPQENKNIASIVHQRIRIMTNPQSKEERSK